VTRDRARKKAIRARMAATGEPYSAAARGLGAARSPGGAETAHEVIVRAERTLAAPSARAEFRIDTDVVPAHPRERRGPGPIGKLARRAVSAAWDRVAPGWDAARVRDALVHQHGEGFIEPAAGRYLIDYGGYAELCADGKRFGGLSGEPLQPRHAQRRAREQPAGPLEFLGMLREVTDARQAGDEMVRGTMCRKVAVQAGSAGLMVWVDDEHIRRVQSEEHTTGASGTVSRRWVLELWDFGVPVGSLDWSRLPSFRS